MNINPTKSKEMHISFAKCTPNLYDITIEGQPIESVQSCKLLGVTLNNKLTWHDHIDIIFKKGCQKIHFMTRLKRTKLSTHDLIKVYVTLIRPNLEYACQLWHGALTDHQCKLLESIQKRALEIIFPNLSYDEALEIANINSLWRRRQTLCSNLFAAIKEPNHKLHKLLPPISENHYNTRNQSTYNIGITQSNRFRNTCINYCILNDL